MPELRQVCDKIEILITKARDETGGKKWADLSRKGFIYTMAGTIPLLEDIYTHFQMARTEVEKDADSSKPDISAHLKDLNKLITLLKRNRELEEGRVSKAQANGLGTLADSITVPDLYADLEQQTISILLKSTYLVERITIFERKKEPIMKTKAAQRNVLELLEKREQEIADLRKKYEETRKNSYLGMVEKDTSADIEHRLNEISRKLETGTQLSKISFAAAKKAFIEMQKNMGETEKTLEENEELEAQALGKTFELITMLKKERDYVKKILIETEHDTIQLRSAYSKELLNLQEEKMSMKNQLEEKYETEFKAMRKDLSDKNELLMHLKDTIISKEKKIFELEEKNDKLKMMNHILNKHEEVKKKFKKK
ncbi:MAG: hypothetical protein COV47_01005 [Candidatus Diapherotrites archaeon CG11_big_fil_rev_8_21_14_0_20_37_9]|nr:MAG: hypothetical protein COV47_01005 [Candidatus Diapherotrites archaeon CG11_big_fil_rev_8_21_14_0_20_37_9]